MLLYTLRIDHHEEVHGVGLEDGLGREGLLVHVLDAGGPDVLLRPGGLGVHRGVGVVGQGGDVGLAQLVLEGRHLGGGPAFPDGLEGFGLSQPWGAHGST